MTIRDRFALFIARRAFARQRRMDEQLAISHEQVVRRFEYVPDEAALRVRRALPPKVLEPK